MPGCKSQNLRLARQLRESRKKLRIRLAMQPWQTQLTLETPRPYKPVARLPKGRRRKRNRRNGSTLATKAMPRMATTEVVMAAIPEEATAGAVQEEMMT